MYIINENTVIYICVKKIIIFMLRTEINGDAWYELG